MKSMGIVGGGQMGSGIAQVAAQAGMDVIVVENSPQRLTRATTTVAKNLDRLVKKGKLSEEAKAEIMGRIRTTTDLDALAAAPLVVEAISERKELKVQLFESLCAICGEDTLLATNTSSLSVTELAAVTKRPDRFIGLHFMNPVPMMQLVEVIRGLATSDETFAAACGLVEQLGKTVVCSQDYPGFLVNRILIPMINEACYALMEGVGSVEDIDKAMTLGCNHPLGPLALADLIGLDIVEAILKVLHEGTGDQKYRPCPLLRRYVAAGFLGRKSGRGFHQYT